MDENELIDTIQRLGTQNIRAKRLILLSRAYLQDPPSLYDLRPSKPGVVTLQPLKSTKRLKARYPPTPISHLPGTGPYALDSYRIFCTLHHDPSSNEWKNVTPTDKELIRFLARLCFWVTQTTVWRRFLTEMEVGCGRTSTVVSGIGTWWDRNDRVFCVAHIRSDVPKLVLFGSRVIACYFK